MLFMMIPFIFFGLSLAYVLWSLVCLERNVRRARSMGIPVIRMPIDPMNVPWLVLEPLLFRLLDRLPFNYGSFGRYSRRGWQFKDKARSHIELGPVWALVTPREIYVWIADLDAINDVFARKADFVRPAQLYKMMDIYGPNVATVGKEDWQRQRKILAAPFNEGTNKLVWGESLSQARDMLNSWTRQGQAGALGVGLDTRTLSLDVLAATGFRRSYKFRSSTEPGSGGIRDYRDALKIVLDNALLLMLAPPMLLALPVMPRGLARIGQATNSLRQYMMDMLNKETSLLEQGEPGTGTLMTSFVRALKDHEKKVDDKHNSSGPSSQGLTVPEILGNLFTINFAGHDTTANTLAFAMLLLAAYPEVQGWITEEVREVIEHENVETWNYDLLFPRLKRCQAVLLETLRVYPPVLSLPKWTNQYPQTLKFSDGRELLIPSHTAVLSSLHAVQLLPRYWGEDSRVWRPTRWILNSPPYGKNEPEPNIFTRLSREQLFIPPKGSYFPWSEGPQNCPGKKFSQVEFVAVLACLFRNHRVRAIPRQVNEDIEETRRRILAVAEDCEVGLLLRMRRADEVRLAWERV